MRSVVNYAHQTLAEEDKGSMDLGNESPLTDLESEETAEPPAKKKRRRKMKVPEPVVYNIPPVETKTTSFKGKDGVLTLPWPQINKQPFRSFRICTFHNV